MNAVGLLILGLLAYMMLKPRSARPVRGDGSGQQPSGGGGPADSMTPGPGEMSVATFDDPFRAAAVTLEEQMAAAAAQDPAPAPSNPPETVTVASPSQLEGMQGPSPFFYARGATAQQVLAAFNANYGYAGMVGVSAQPAASGSTEFADLWNVTWRETQQ